MSRKLEILLVSATLAVLASANTWAGAEQSSSPSAASSPANKPEPLQEVTVTAQRSTLTQRVQKFVGKITGPLFNGGLTRWGQPVCPLVSGLPREEGEYILGRVSDIARAAGVPLAGEKCLPNLYILVTPQPQRLLRWMDERHLASTFGFDATPGVIHEFISEPAPVRILYRDAPTSWSPSYPYVSSAKVGPITMSGDNWYFDSHGPMYRVMWHVFRAFVIVNQAQLKGVTRGQFADYVALVGLTQIKPADSLADAPTILKLFNGAPQAAPAEMTDWDRAFLKSLYTTDQRLHGQRWHIAHAMVSEIAH